MLKQFAPKARMPPSPKKTACTSKATLMPRHADQGPKRMAMSVPPTAWPVVPPGRGMLNIIARKTKAAPMPKSGRRSCGICSRTFFTAMSQTGTMTAPTTAQVSGLR